MTGADLVVVATDERSAAAAAADRSGAGETAVWAALAEAALRAEGVTAGECSLVFVDPDEMARLNAEHMGEEGPTDVLSFPLDGADPDPVGTRLVGDVVVCPAYAARNGGSDGALAGTPDGDPAGTPVATPDGDPNATPDGGLALLVVHGVLHLLGYDHADAADAARMQARERELLAACHRP